MASSLFRSRRSDAKNRAAPATARFSEPRQLVRVVRRESASDRAVLLELRAADGVALEPFEAGAHIDLHIAPGLIRQYSLIDVERSDGAYVICVQREKNGRGGSTAVHDRVREGETLAISSPRNTFGLKQPSGRVLLLAAGVGVTPLVSMAAHLHRSGSNFEFHVYTRFKNTLPLAHYLESAHYRDHVFVHDSSLGDSFRTSAPSALKLPVDGGAVYACGPEAFVTLARDRALNAGWRTEQFHSERFSPASPPVFGDSSSFTVVAASTGEEMMVTPGESIADVLERHGYETYRSCGQGYCGSCVTRVVAGIPDHRDDTQSADEHAANSHINVCCSRSLTPTLELDV